MSITKNDVVKLIDELYEASKLYYVEGEESFLSDEEFDAKQEFLTEIFESGEFEELFESGGRGFSVLEEVVGGGLEEGSEKIIHSTPMLSLQKAKTVSELETFLKRVQEFGAKEFRLQPKIDGIALSVVYEDGVLTQVATRGNGVVGENTLFLLEKDDVKVVGVPESIEIMGRVELRGELVFSAEQFKKVDDARFSLIGERFKNPRNAVSGLQKKAKLGVEFPVEFTFLTYSVLVDGKLSSEKIEGVLSVNDLIKDNIFQAKDVFNGIERFGEVREKLEYPTDGVVIKPVEEERLHSLMGVTAHHPSSQIAWKYPAEKTEAVVLDVDVSVGKSGRLTPRAHITPVFLDGSTVSKVSLHNFNNVVSKKIKIGSVVSVEKANDIIPHISVVLSNPEDAVEIPIPSKCPVCDTELVGDSVGGEVPKTLLCPNEGCPSRDFYSLMAAVGRNYLNIDRLSESVLTFLYDEGIVKDVSDLYLLNEEILADAINGYTSEGKPRRLGERTAAHIMRHVEESKTLPTYRILASLAIENLGRTVSSLLLENFTFEELLEAKAYDLEKIKGVGPISAASIVKGLQSKREVINKMMERGVVFSSDEVVKEGKLTGLSFSISGGVPAVFKNRSEFTEFLNSVGSKFNANPTKDTDYMIGDESSSSSKIVKAKSLGVPIISPEEFISLM